MSRFGTSPKMVTGPASLCSGGTTPARTNGRSKISSSDPESTSFSELMTETPSLFGELLSTARTVKKASSARSSETKASTSRQSLSDRLTKSLITAGLIKGTTPSLVRQTFGLSIRDFASLPLDGSEAAKATAANSSSND
ncbi:hypothetical protein ACLMJV_16895 [Sinorhizobium meliloti]|uniref:hypothetical protein n=1 Tax=Rhizobium meliloti TaxID=382 RepID=UPI00398D5A04